MAALLQLPVELRLKIYELAISSSPNAINVDEGATSTDPPRSSTARSLLQFDEQLVAEILPLYWGSNIWEAHRLNGMGHHISTDRTFHRWLRNIVKDSIIHVRHLRFKGAHVASTTEMQIHAPQCIMIVEVDLKLRHIAMWSKKGESCSCDHASILGARMNEIVAQLPTVAGQLQSSQEVLWTLFECWYTYNPMRATTLRSLSEFQRQVGNF